MLTPLLDSLILKVFVGIDNAMHCKTLVWQALCIQMVIVIC